MNKKILYNESIYQSNKMLVLKRCVFGVIEMVIIIIFVNIYFPVWWESSPFITFLWCYFLGRIWIAYLFVRDAHVLVTIDELVYTYPKKIFQKAEVLHIPRKNILSIQFRASGESLNILYQKDHKNQILHITYREIEEYPTDKLRRLYNILQKR